MTVFTNARVVTRAEVLRGTVVIEDGLIRHIDSGVTSLAGAIDCEGDFLIPGLIDLHTDALDRHCTPRPGVRWPMPAAIQAHDAQVVVSGVTTVFDALALGVGGEDESIFVMRSRECMAVLGGRAADSLRAQHFLHLRLELPSPSIADVFLEFADLPQLKLVSLMDHTPGQGQYADLGVWRRSIRQPLTPEDIEARLRQRLEFRELYAEANRERLARTIGERGLPLASHDDRTAAEVERGASLGVSITEFPVTLEAARAAKQCGMTVAMGAPNLVLGGSHSGNAAASEVAVNGWLDGLTSDYVPASMLQAAFLLNEQHGFTLPAAIDTVTARPAKMVGLDDRGSLTPGLRADVVRVRRTGELPQVISVWRGGARVV